MPDKYTPQAFNTQSEGHALLGHIYACFLKTNTHAIFVVQQRQNKQTYKQINKRRKKERNKQTHHAFL